jgi:hypothetical protein
MPAAPLLTCFLTASAYAAVSTPCTTACRRSRFEDPQARSEAWASSALGRGALPARGGETCPEEVDAVHRRGAPAATRRRAPAAPPTVEPPAARRHPSCSSPLQIWHRRHLRPSRSHAKALPPMSPPLKKGCRWVGRCWWRRGF